MTGPRRRLHLVQLLPNLMTIGALCAGLTAMRFATEGRFGFAVAMIVLAAVLDGLDGRLARLLKSDSEMGAELDSLCDLVNFGVAPAMVMHLWAFADNRNEGWIAALLFAVACVLRLARFNLGTRDPNYDGSSFTGVPSPAGAMLVLLPLFLARTFGDGDPVAPQLIALWMVAVGAMMVGKFQTPSFKSATFYADHGRFVVLGFVLLVAALVTYPWVTLMVFDLAYLVLVAHAALRGRAPGAGSSSDEV